MKLHNRKIRNLLVGATGIFLGVASSGALAGTITGSAHDFSKQLWSGGQICVACHTPHFSDTSVTLAPLWNHEITTATFTMYSRSSIDGTIDTEPTGVSKLCLSCHDGTVALDSYGGATGGSYIPTQYELGTNLSDDHPISITYNTTTATADGAMNDPATTSVIIGEGGTKTKTGTINDVMLSDGKVQCSSCHDVHNNFVAGTGGDPLLKVSLTASKLCLTCHNK